MPTSVLLSEKIVETPTLHVAVHAYSIDSLESLTFGGSGGIRSSDDNLILNQYTSVWQLGLVSSTRKRIQRKSNQQRWRRTQEHGENDAAAHGGLV